MKRETLKKRRFIIVLGLVILMLILGILIYLENYSLDKAFERYMGAVNEGQYEEMYAMLTEESRDKYSKDSFIEENKKIYELIEAKNIKATLKGKERTYLKEYKKGGVRLYYDFNMDIASGDYFSDFGRVVFVQEPFYNWKLDWDTRVIFPDFLNGLEVIRKNEDDAQGEEAVSILMGPVGDSIENYIELADE